MSNQNQIENSCEIGGVIITITIIALGIGIIGFLVWFLVFGLDLWLEFIIEEYINNVRPRYKILHNLPIYCLNFHHCPNYSNNGILVLLSCKVIQILLTKKKPDLIVLSAVRYLINGENEFYFFICRLAGPQKPSTTGLLAQRTIDVYWTR